MKNNKRLVIQVLTGQKFEGLQDDIFVELALPHQQVQTSVCSAEQAEWNEQFVMAVNEQDTLQVRLRDTQDKILAQNVLSLCLLPKAKHVQVWVKLECQEGAAVALDLLAEDFGLQWLQEEVPVMDPELMQKQFHVPKKPDNMYVTTPPQQHSDMNQQELAKMLNFLQMTQQVPEQEEELQTPVQQVLRNVRMPPSPLRQANPQELSDEQELTDDQLAALYEAIMTVQQQQRVTKQDDEENAPNSAAQQQQMTLEQLLPYLLMQAKQKQ